MLSYDSSSLFEESKSNGANSQESRDELESVLGIRDRYAIPNPATAWSEPKPVSPAKEIVPSIPSIGSPDPFAIDEGYHDIGDDELAAEHAADSMMEV